MQTKPLPEDLVPKSFMDQFGSLIKCVLGGWDRLRFHASLRPLFSPQWMRTYLCAAKVRLVDFAAHAKELTQRLLEEAQNLAAAAQRPYHFLRSSQTSKEQFIEDIAQRDHVQSGLIAVLGTVEPCLAMTVRGARDRRWLQPVLEQRKCLHLYHYYEHPVVGRCHVRLQTWYPFSVDVCLNGRLWLAKQMDAAGLAYRRADNCFIELADPARAQALASTQVGTPLGQMAEPLCRPLTHDGRRYRALHPLGTDAALLRALSRGEWVIAGFRNRDLQHLLYTGQPRDKKAARRRSAAISRKLRLLRAHGLIRKLPHTHRYLVTESGRGVLTALVAAQQASTQKLTLALAA